MRRVGTRKGEGVWEKTEVGGTGEGEVMKVKGGEGRKRRRDGKEDRKGGREISPPPSFLKVGAWGCDEKVCLFYNIVMRTFEKHKCTTVSTCRLLE